MNTLDAIAKRRSIRKYKSEQIEDANLEQVIKAGQIAPNAGPFHISVIQNAELLNKIAEVSVQAMKDSGIKMMMNRAAVPGFNPLYGAPTLVVLSASPKNPYSMANIAAAGANMTVAATDLGLGSCLMATPELGFKADAALAAAAGIPEGFSVILCATLGYIDDDVKIPARTETDNVNYIK